MDGRRAFDRGEQGAAADHEVAGVDKVGNVQLAGVQAVEGEFDEVQGGAGSRLIFRLQALLSLLVAEPEPRAEHVAILRQIRHGGVAFP